MTTFLRLSALGLLFGVQIARAQTAILTGIEDYSSGRMNAITTRGEVTGYLFSYKMHPEDTNYYLRIFDENLQVAGNTRFNAGPSVALSNSFYESGKLMLVCTEYLKKEEALRQQIRILSLDSSVSTTYRYTPDAEEQRIEKDSTFRKIGAWGGYYRQVDGLGLLGTYDFSHAKGGLVAVLVQPDGRQKWKHKNASMSNYFYTESRLVAAHPKIILYCLTGKSTRNASEGHRYLLGLDPETGTQRFLRLLEDSTDAWEPMFAKPMPDGNLLLCNNITDVKSSLTEALQTGFNYGIVDPQTGVLQNLRTVHYSTDLGEAVEMRNRSKSREGFMHLSDILTMPDRSTVIVGEFYKRTVSAESIIASMGTAYSQGTINDLFLMHLDTSGAVNRMDRIDHKPVRVPLPPYQVSIGRLGQYLEYANAFNYHHTDASDPDVKKIFVLGNTTGKGISLGMLQVDTGGYRQTSLLTAASLKKEPAYIFKAKPGHVLLLRSERKSKNVKLELLRTD